MWFGGRVRSSTGAATGIDWAASQRALSECREYLEELRVLLSELNLDGKARGAADESPDTTGGAYGSVATGITLEVSLNICCC